MLLLLPIVQGFDTAHPKLDDWLQAPTVELQKNKHQFSHQLSHA